MVRVLTDLGLPVELARARAPALRIEVALHGDERYAAAGEDRHRRAAAAGLRAVLRPETVAVVGAGRARDVRSAARCCAACAPPASPARCSR